MMNVLMSLSLMTLAGGLLLTMPSAGAAEDLGLNEVGAIANNTKSNSIEPAATTVEEWRTQLVQAERVEITNVQVEETADGFTLRLEATGELATPAISVTGNAAIADIPMQY
ncbi:MAG: hypothetical protein ACTS2F_28555 [Thainema sp.]